MYAGQLISKTS